MTDKKDKNWKNLFELDLVQVRTDISWVFGNGHQIGFRYAEGVQDQSDLGNLFGEINGTVFDSYRFYYLHSCPWGGYNQFFLGGSDENHTIIGAEYDLPLNSRWALQTGFTYLIPDSQPDDNTVGNQNEAWNLSMGVVWRPRGRNWYKYYHRPLLPVADNGSMILRRVNTLNNTN